MKTIIIILSFLLLNGTEANAQKKIKFYYYPVANVYYNTTTATYSYIENNNWVSAPALPATFVIKHSPRQIVFHTDTEVWNNNHHHRMNYATTADGIPVGMNNTGANLPKTSIFKRSINKRKGKL